MSEQTVPLARLCASVPADIRQRLRQAQVRAFARTCRRLPFVPLPVAQMAVATTCRRISMESGTLFVDRRQGGEVDFSPAFPALHSASLRPEDGVIRLHIFVDRASVEVFANDGLVVMTELIFPHGPGGELALFADGGVEGEGMRVNSLEVWGLRAAAGGAAMARG